MNGADNAEGWIRWTFIIRNHVLRRIFWHLPRRFVFFFPPATREFFITLEKVSKWFLGFSVAYLDVPRQLTRMWTGNLHRLPFHSRCGCYSRWNNHCLWFRAFSIILKNFFHWKLFEDFSVEKIWLLNDFLAFSGAWSDVFTVFMIFIGNLTLF